MTKLQKWMASHGKLDGDVARATRISRPHISRIRRGRSGASPSAARKLEALTGIRWWNFVGGQ